MDKDARNRLLAATQAARTVLEQDYAEQLEGTFAISPDGDMAVEPGAHLDAAQHQIRTQLAAAIHHAVAGSVNISHTAPAN